MPDLKLVSLLLMAALYILAGISHFRQPKFFLSIMPRWVPAPEAVNRLVGLLEVALGLALLFAATRPYAAAGIIALLIAVFPANVYHYQKARKQGRAQLLILLRLPLQGLLLYWAYTFLGPG